jgi:hypothetical protein
VRCVEEGGVCVTDVLEQDTAAVGVMDRPREHSAPAVGRDERAARRTLLRQIERMEYELSSLFVSAWPRKGFDFSVPGRGGPSLLSFGELEELRDELLDRTDQVKRALGERAQLEESYRRRIEEMLLEPEKHKWVRISNEDIGEPGCKHWHVRPRWGILGMLMNWWRVRISSGCPLPGPRVRVAA